MTDATTVADLGERALLRHIRSRVPLGPGVVVGVGDDAAAVETGRLTLVTTDALVESVHFRRDWTPPRLLGRKALAVNLSDVAAMAGVPRFATVSLCLPADLPLAFLDGLYDGLLERAAEAGMYLIGGNISATEGPMVIDVTLLGMGERLLRRAGALPGDVAVVTGSLGAAAEGLRLLREGARLAPDGSLETPGLWSEASGDAVAACLRAQLDPVPPIAFACALAEHEIAHAGIDISDGLSGDLLALCQESGVRAFLDPAGVPVDPSAAALEAARGGDALELAMHGGEDYQLLLAVPPERLQSLRDIAVVWELPLSVVGQFHEGEAGVDFRTAEGAAPLAPLSHEHFRAGLRGCPPPAST